MSIFWTYSTSATRHLDRIWSLENSRMIVEKKIYQKRCYCLLWILVCRNQFSLKKRQVPHLEDIAPEDMQCQQDSTTYPTARESLMVLHEVFPDYVISLGQNWPLAMDFLCRIFRNPRLLH